MLLLYDSELLSVHCHMFEFLLVLRNQFLFCDFFVPEQEAVDDLGCLELYFVEFEVDSPERGVAPHNFYQLQALSVVDAIVS